VGAFLYCVIWGFFANKEAEHLDSKSILIVKAYIGK